MIELKIELRNRDILRTAAVMVFLTAAPVLSLPAPGYAAGESQSAPSSGSVGEKQSDVERVNVDTLKQKYWEKGEETEIRVVQNRLYTKALKFELGTFGGTVSTDPFLSVKHLGGVLGFHLSEYFSLNMLGWRSYSNPSSALQRLEEETNRSANTNDPKSFIGGEVGYSPIYGKLSLLGKAIIHYDMHVSLGGGMTNTQSGRYFTPFLGIGQQVYINKYVTFRMDYRLMRYRETILEEHKVGEIGNVIGERTNYSDVISLGFTFIAGFF